MSELRVPALQLAQGPTREIYSFGIDGKLLHRFAAVSRVGRDDDAAIRGYQRPEVLVAHQRDPRLHRVGDADDPERDRRRVRLARSLRARTTRRDGVEIAAAQSGTLVIPLDEEERPGWIVDGQQRAAAIRDARVERFPIFVNAFITEEVAEQRAQFILVNSTKPLPKGLIHELLPATEAPLAARAAQAATAGAAARAPQLRRRLAAAGPDPDADLDDGHDQGQLDPEDAREQHQRRRALPVPLHRPRPPRRRRDAAASSRTSGRRSAQVFDDAWDKPPRQSRLTHGLGILSLGFLMDAIAERFEGIEPTVAEFEARPCS